MRWLNDIRVKVDEDVDVTTDFMQVENGILILMVVSHKKGLYENVSTLVLIDSVYISE